MRRLTQILLAVTLLILAARAWLFGVYAWNRFPLNIEIYHLESKMVHLAWRIQHGVRLYPDWQNYPHVANFFGPLYFALVGALGAIRDSSIHELYLIGRAVTIASVVAASGLLFEALRSRYGLFAALFGTLNAIGAGPLYGFGVMTRPDVFADFLGLAGFLVLVGLHPRTPGARPPRSSRFLAAMLMIAAILAKQTTAAYALAAALTLALNGHPRTATTWLAAVLGTIVAIVLGITLLHEPNFGPSLLAEGRTPWDLRGWTFSLWRIVTLDPEFLVLLGVGIALWATSPRAEIAPIVLTLVITGTAVVTLAKYGSDMNYFLGTRHAAAWAAAAFWHSAWSSTASRPRIAVILAATIPIIGLLTFSITHSLVQTEIAEGLNAFRVSPQGQAYQAAHQRIFEAAEDPGYKLLTDSGLIDIRQGERTAFGDPWLFRMLAETGQINTDKMRQWAESESYDQIITTKALEDPEYETYDFGLPMPIVEAARRHYLLVGVEFGLFFYRPRHEILPPLTPPASEDSHAPGASP